MRKVYGFWLVGAILLIAGCTTDDAVSETASEEAIAIAFGEIIDGAYKSYKTYGTYNGAYGPHNEPTRAAHQGAMNSEDLYYTGFGVFASITAEKVPDLMYNQEVEFTFVGDMENPLKGYWSYQPVKYWPANMTNFYMSAYAPYMEPGELEGFLEDETKTGIISISSNTTAPYIAFRRCKDPQSCTDLLWYYESLSAIPAPSGKQRGLLDMKMRHALARLEINVALATAQPEGTKVLIDSIALTGRMAKTAHLHLYEQTTDTVVVNEEKVVKYYPVWSDQTYDKTGGGADTDHTIVIDNDDNNTESYGIIDAPVRYIKGLPYAWQPAGLKAYDAEAADKGYQNVLSTGDRNTYIYLIPQGALSLEIKVRYRKMTSGGGNTMGVKTTTAAVTTVANPLKGNTTYTLNLKLSEI